MGNYWKWSNDDLIDWLEQVTDSVQTVNNKEHNHIMSVGNSEMLKITEDGFYVRGVRVPADENEAKTVYEAFKSFLIWSQLNQH